MIEFSQFAALEAFAIKLFDARKPNTPLDQLARDLLRAFDDVCRLAGLDNVLDALEGRDDEAALVAQLQAIDLDGGGPRNAKPRQLAECVVKTLELVVVDPPAPQLTLGDDGRTQIMAAVTSVANAELAVPAIRDTIIAEARAHSEEGGAFNKVVAALDDRGEKLTKAPKVPIDTLHAVQKALADARTMVLTRLANTVFERIAPLLPEGILDRPITTRSTPREVAILRISRVGLAPSFVIKSLFDAITELVRIEWRAPEQTVHTYAASKTFDVGDLIEHPKFGRGTVVSRLNQRIEVDFGEKTPVTLMHVPAGGAKAPSSMPVRSGRIPPRPSEDD